MPTPRRGSATIAIEGVSKSAEKTPFFVADDLTEITGYISARRWATAAMRRMIEDFT